ncbi:MAG TPA: hypothetical protein VGC87_23635 [Pyrinomonadaceae bacterium]|jgi:hypothetical protein
MSIANELSSEVAAAVLSRDEEGSAESVKLKDVVMRVHSELREMKGETRRKGLGPRDVSDPPAGRSASNSQ